MLLAIARRSLKDTPVTIVSLNHLMASCVVGVWLGCISIVPTTVQESSTPDSKENKQAHAGGCLFLEGLFCVARYYGECRAHGFLRGGVGRKYRAAQQGAIVNIQYNVQYSFD